MASGEVGGTEPALFQRPLRGGDDGGERGVEAGEDVGGAALRLADQRSVQVRTRTRQFVPPPSTTHEQPVGHAISAKPKQYQLSYTGKNGTPASPFARTIRRGRTHLNPAFSGYWRSGLPALFATAKGVTKSCSGALDKWFYVGTIPPTKDREGSAHAEP